jgi:hypothetical protein
MRENVKTQFRIFRRHGIFPCEDARTGKQESLKTRDRRKWSAIAVQFQPT